MKFLATGICDAELIWFDPQYFHKAAFIYGTDLTTIIIFLVVLAFIF